MSGKLTWGNAWIYLRRAMLLRCPVCGMHPMFPSLARTRNAHDWFTPLDGCPRCGYAYDREPGYFLLSTWAINYGFAASLGLFLYFVFEWFYDWPVWTLITAVVVPVVAFNLLFVRHSKAIFIAWDHLFDPHEKESGDDDGNVRREPASPAPQPPQRARLPEKVGA